MALPNPNPPFNVSPPVVTTGDDFPGAERFATFAIDEATGDLEFPIRVVTGVDAIRLRLLSRLNFFKREWFLDLRQGMPYYDVVYVKNPSIALVQSVFRRAILSTPGVQSILKMTTVLNSATRSFVIKPLDILLYGGVIFRAQPNEFIIPVAGSKN